VTPPTPAGTRSCPRHPTAYRTAHQPARRTALDTRAAVHPPAVLRVPAEIFAAVRAGETGHALRAFGPFAGETEAKTFVAEKLGGHGYVIPFELKFPLP
jgi:hypothetical protein